MTSKRRKIEYSKCFASLSANHPEPGPNPIEENSRVIYSTLKFYVFLLADYGHVTFSNQ